MIQFGDSDVSYAHAVPEEWATLIWILYTSGPHQKILVPYPGQALDSSQTTLPDFPSILISALRIPSPSVPVLELTTATLQLKPVVDVARVFQDVDVVIVPLYEFAANALVLTPNNETTNKATTKIDFKDTESLGLQLVNSLINQINGDIKLISVDEGTKFVISFWITK